MYSTSCTASCDCVIGSDSRKISIPTLHVYGESDEICPMRESVDFLETCEDARTVIHPGGHFFPAAAPQKKLYVEFLREMRDGFTMDGPGQETLNELKKHTMI